MPVTKLQAFVPDQPIYPTGPTQAVSHGVAGPYRKTDGRWYEKTGTTETPIAMEMPEATSAAQILISSGAGNPHTAVTGGQGKSSWLDVGTAGQVLTVVDNAGILEIGWAPPSSGGGGSALPDATTQFQVLMAKAAGTAETQAEWSDLGFSSYSVTQNIPLMFMGYTEGAADVKFGFSSGLEVIDNAFTANTSHDQSIGSLTSLAPEAAYTQEEQLDFVYGLAESTTLLNPVGQPRKYFRRYRVYHDNLAQVVCSYKLGKAVVSDPATEATDNYQVALSPGGRQRLQPFKAPEINNAINVPDYWGLPAGTKKIVVNEAEGTFEVNHPSNYLISFTATLQFKPIIPSGYSAGARDGTSTPPAGYGTKPSGSYAISIIVDKTANGNGVVEYRGVQSQFYLQGNDIAYYLGMEETTSATTIAELETGDKVYARAHWFSFNNMNNWQLQLTADRSGQGRCFIQELGYDNMLISTWT